jgi:hypothetical protein
MSTIKKWEERFDALPINSKCASVAHQYMQAEITQLREALEQLLDDYRETVNSAVERGNQIVLLKARIAELEAAQHGN